MEPNVKECQKKNIVIVIVQLNPHLINNKNEKMKHANLHCFLFKFQ